MVTRHDTEKGRYYEIAKGATRPSVTTVLSTVWPSGGLDNWRFKNQARSLIAQGDVIGARLTRAHTAPARMRTMMATPLAKDLKLAAEDTTAADRGTRIHSLVETALRGGNIEDKAHDIRASEEELVAADVAVREIRTRCPKILRAEVVVTGTDPIPYAGQADLIASWKDSPHTQGRPSVAVIDLKTGRRLSRSWAPQLAAYALADQWVIDDELTPKPNVTKALVLHVTQGSASWYEADLRKGSQLWRAAALIWRAANGTSPLLTEV